MKKHYASPYENKSNFLIGLFSVALIYIFYDVVVAFVYEATESLAALNADEAIGGSEGNKFRQIIYALMIASCAVFFFKKQNFTVKRFLLAIPLSYSLAIVWAILSSSWAIDPSISIRRSLLMFAILLPIGLCIHYLGVPRVIKLMYWFFVALIVASYTSVLLNSIPLFSFSIHPPNELDQAVAGAWRGVMSHKNSAGPVFSHAAIFFFFHMLAKRRGVNFLLFSLCMVFIFFTKSKTSIALVFLCIIIGLIYRAYASRGNLLMAQILTLGGAIGAVILLLTMTDQITNFFSDYQNLTGRVGIWTSMMPYIQDHFWLGSGYGSFWGIGERSPIFQLAVERYITRLGTSHNGFIEIWATTGIIGLSLVVFSLVLVPYVRFMRPPSKDNSNLYATFFTMWIFGILQNFSESQIFSPEKQSWIFVVVGILSIYSMQTKEMTQIPVAKPQRTSRLYAAPAE